MDYGRTLSKTFEGKHAQIMRLIFKRASLLADLELREKKSLGNLKFIEENLASPLTLQEKLDEERRRARARKKLAKVSDKIVQLLKEENEFSGKYKQVLKHWCNHLPIRNTMKQIWRLFERIKD